jgi:putative transposase
MIRATHKIRLGRFCELIGVPRSTYHRWRRPGRVPSPQAAPVVDRIEQQVAECALTWPAWGHRKIHALLQVDGLAASTSSVARAMRRRDLLLPVGYHAERRQLAQARREAFITPPTGRNQVWQTDFSELETTSGGTWQFSPVVDYHAKLSLSSPASTTKTTHDAISAVEAAIREAERLLARPLITELTDPDTGEITPIRLVSDNGPCYRSGGFAAYIRRRPELVHIRTRYRSPETNGLVECPASGNGQGFGLVLCWCWCPGRGV